MIKIKIKHPSHYIICLNSEEKTGQGEREREREKNIAGGKRGTERKRKQVRG